jgi:hypothetical protein
MGGRASILTAVPEGDRTQMRRTISRQSEFNNVLEIRTFRVSTFPIPIAARVRGGAINGFVKFRNCKYWCRRPTVLSACEGTVTVSRLR